jgi:peptidoglycan/xylan/chitin deacetylase (PgdA/CDA1 family)
MQEAGIRFGCHSYAHRDLTALSEEECERDLRASRELLEDILGRPVTLLAYPFGRQDEGVRRAAERAGFTHAFAMSRGNGRVGNLNIPRMGIYAGNGVPTLWAKASWYLPVKRSPLFRLLPRLTRRHWPSEGPKEQREVA